MSPHNISVLVVDDEKIFRREAVRFLRKEGYFVGEEGDGEGAIQAISVQDWDVILLDLALPGIGGIEVLREIQAKSPETVVIVVTAFASLETAVEALRLGAFDYLTKPLRFDDLALRLQKLAGYKRTEQENKLLKQLVREHIHFHEIIGESEKIRQVFKEIQQLEHSKANVLISGESGVGKELIARAVHEHSPNKDNPFLPINISAIPESMLASQLFGHVKGAFTGATGRHRGIFQAAQGGTVFLDEIGELPLSLQPQLLRALEEKEIFPLGAEKPVNVEFRLLAATHRDLAKMVKEGTFREDLYYRLHVFHLEVPPLRERKEDIPLLVNHFVAHFSAQMKKRIKGISREAMQILLVHDWSGNVRELRNAIERAVILVPHEQSIQPQHLPRTMLQEENTTSLNLKEAVASFEKKHIQSVLTLAKGNKEQAAKWLGLSLATLYRRLEKYDLLSQN